MHNKNHDGECELLFFVIIEMGKMGTGRALQKSLFIRNACGYKAKLVLGFLNQILNIPNPLMTIRVCTRFQIFVYLEN